MSSKGEAKEEEGRGRREWEDKEVEEGRRRGEGTGCSWRRPVIDSHIIFQAPLMALHVMAAYQR